MPARSEFVDHLLDLLAPLGGVSARKLFGGWGFFRGGKMFALVAYETFYVKVDDATRAEFAGRGLAPFSYETQNGRREVMAYHTVPAEALDSSPLLCEWAEKGIAAAGRAKGRVRGAPLRTPRPQRIPNRRVATTKGGKTGGLD